MRERICAGFGKTICIPKLTRQRDPAFLAAFGSADDEVLSTFVAPASDWHTASKHGPYQTDEDRQHDRIKCCRQLLQQSRGSWRKSSAELWSSGTFSSSSWKTLKSASLQKGECFMDGANTDRTFVRLSFCPACHCNTNRSSAIHMFRASQQITIKPRQCCK